MLQFHTLASSSAGNAYLATDGQARLGIEAGLPWRQYQLAMKHQVSRLNGVLVTHQHADHSRAIKDVLKAGVDVYTSDAVAETIGRSHRLHVLPTNGVAVRIGDWRVLAFDLIHDVPCIGFLIQGPSGQKLAFITDTGYVPITLQGIDVLAVEANYSEPTVQAHVKRGVVDPRQAKRLAQSHLSIEQVLELVKAVDLRRCREIHLLHLSAGNSSARQFKHLLESATGIPTHIAPERGALA